MNPSMPTKPASNQAVELDATRQITEHHEAGLNQKSGKQVANQLRAAAGKNDSRYWASRIFRPVNASGAASPHYSMKVQFRGRRMAFTLGTGNKDAAARRAAGIYTDLLTLGVEATLSKHRAQSRGEIPSKVATIGEWIEAARGVSASNATSFAQYAASLRLIAGQILSVNKTKKRFGPGPGGARAYRAGIDAQSLEILSEQAVQRWRLAYVAQAGNPAQERSRMTSANSTILQARSLFANKIVRFLPDTRLPSPPPFTSVEFFPRQSAHYFSRIDPKALLRAAQGELAGNDPPAFLAMLLALAAGLRRAEIDSLAWHQIDFERALIRVEATESASLKTSDSRAEVPIDGGVVEVLRGFRGKASGSFVIEGGRRRIRAASVGTPLPGGRSFHAAEPLASQAWRERAQADPRAAQRAWGARDRRARHLCRFPRLEAFERGHNGCALHRLENPPERGDRIVAHSSQCRCDAAAIASPAKSFHQEEGSQRRPTGSSSFNCAVNGKPNPLPLKPNQSRKAALSSTLSMKTKARGGHSGAKQCAKHTALLLCLGS